MTKALRASSILAAWILPHLLITVIPRTVNAEEQRKVWIGVTGMLSNYKMEDVNNGIRELGLALLGGQFVDDIPVGLGFGAGLGADVSSNIAISVDYDRYTARASGGGFNTDLQPERIEVAVSLPANSVGVSVEYRRHYGAGIEIPEAGTWNIGVGATGGLIWMNGDLDISTEGQPVDNTTISGSGPMFEGFLAADTWQNPRLGFTASVGYRYAKVDNPEMKNSDGGDPSGTLAAIDYSGLFVQVGLKFSLQ